MDVDPFDVYEDRPPDPSEQEDRECVALALRSIRGQIRQWGHSDITCGLMREWQCRAKLFQSFRHADRAWQRGGSRELRRTA